MDVSIIIPTYNRLWSLPKAINSCFEPDLLIEIIVVDDGSADGTWEWLTNHENIVAVRQNNMGKDWAVNKGFALATGKYVRFLDSDDWLLPGSTSKLFDEAEKSGADIVCAGYQSFDEDERYIDEIKWTLCDDFLAQQLGECDSSHYSAYLFKKSFLSDIPHRQEFGALDDRQFIIETALKGPKTSYIQSPTLAHRKHKNERLQSSSGLVQTANHLSRLNIYKRCFGILESENRLTQRYKDAASNILWHLSHWVAHTHLGEAKKIYDWVYELAPHFTPKENLSLARMYKSFGFVNTEKLLRFRRRIKFK
ncbi:MAG TPA: glycosyltransferase family 2 protein [Mucilaginibacter sp.]|nr:glycosyltransferase family 2 protein [Mucilaginibacter sp.]